MRTLALLIALVSILGFAESPTTLLTPEERAVLLAKRFIDPEHWSQVLVNKQVPDGTPISGENSTQSLLNLYGAASMDAWIITNEHVEKNSNRLPSVGDLFEVHEKVYRVPGNTFKTYYEQNAKLSSLRQKQKEQLLDLIKSGQNQKIKDQFNIDEPFGQFRDGKVTVSKNIGSDPLYTKEQLERLRANPFLEIVSEKPVGEKYKVNIRFPPPEKVSGLTQEAFSAMQKECAELKAKFPQDQRGSSEYEKEATLIAAKFYHKVVSIHPLWDGVGRTSKLVRDWVLLHLGLPPPASTPANDFELTAEELAESLRSGIKETRRRTMGSDKIALSKAELYKVRKKYPGNNTEAVPTGFSLCKLVKKLAGW